MCDATEQPKKPSGNVGRCHLKDKWKQSQHQLLIAQNTQNESV